MKKIILAYIYWNIDIFAFFFPFKTKFDLTKPQYKKKFSLKFFYLFKNFDFFLKIKILFFLIFIQIFPLFICLKFFRNLTTENQSKIIYIIKSLNINNFSRGLLALESQSIIINFSIFKLSIKNGN